MNAGLYTTHVLERLETSRVIGRSRATFERPWLRRHGPWLTAMAAIAVWLCRRILFTDALPAGTDILGFITRARQNAHLSEIASPWAPSSLGAIRQFTLDNLLGGITLITRDPVATVKLLIFLTLFASGASAYALSWRWYRNHHAAAFAGVFFMLSQASLTRWGSGELNVEIAIAFAPFIILVWDACLRRPSVRRIAVLALALGLVLLVRPDMVLYTAPFLALQTAVHTALTPRGPALVAAAVRTTVIAIGSLVLLSAAQVVPLLFGVRAHWLTTGSLFSPHDFAQRSLDAYQSLLGFGREIGYFAFTGQQTWVSHPWLPGTLYQSLATALLLLAVGSMWWHRGPRSVFLLASIACGAFLAKGMREPLGEPYLFAVRHLPVFGSMRDPNRWLIVPSLAVASLGGLTFSHAVRWSSCRLQATRGRRLILTLGSVLVIAALLMPVGPTILRGLMIWRPAEGQIALMDRVAQDGSQFAVATIPYDQTYRFLTQGHYHGYEHDLGAESAAFTGHPALADGGWQQSTVNFVSSTANLLSRRDPAFWRLLGTAGVKYLLDFNYPETAPHLLPGSVLSRPHAPSVGTWRQQQAWLAMRPSLPLARDDAGSLYRLPTWSPPVSFRTNLAVIFGGLAGTAAFADLPGIHIERWAAVQSDDAVTQGLPRLIALIHSADLLVMANESLRSTALLAVPPIADIPGITSNPDLEHLTQLLTVDQSVRSGSLANQKLPPPVSGPHRVGSTFSLARPRTLQLWARVEASRNAAKLVFRLDSREIGSYTPVALQAGPMVWHCVGTFALPPGQHTFSAAAKPSFFGDSYEIDELRLVDRAQLRRADKLLTSAVDARAGHLIVSLDTSSLPLGLQDKSLYTVAKTVTSSPGSFWAILEDKAARASPNLKPDAPLVILISGPRRLYTIAQHTFATPQDWRRRDYLFLKFGGDAGGSTYNLFVDFNRRHIGSAEYELPGGQSTSRTVALSTADARSAIPAGEWRHVVSVRITSDSRNITGSLSLGTLGISGRVGPVSVRYPVPCALGRRSFLEGSGLSVRRYPCALSLKVRPTSLNTARVSEGSSIEEHPAAQVAYRRTAPTSYVFAVKSHTRGWLMLNQSFDSRWILDTGGTVARPTPLYSAVNGYAIGGGTHSGTVSLRGSQAATAGVSISAVCLIGLLGLAIADPAVSRLSPNRRRRRRSRRNWTFPRIPRRSPSFWTGCIAVIAVVAAGRSVALSIGLGALILLVYRVQWWMCLASAALLIAIAPFVAMVTPVGADALAVDVIALLIGAVVLILLEERRRFARSATTPSL